MANSKSREGSEFLTLGFHSPETPDVLYLPGKLLNRAISSAAIDTAAIGTAAVSNTRHMKQSPACFADLFNLRVMSRSRLERGEMRVTLVANENLNALTRQTRSAPGSTGRSIGDRSRDVLSGTDVSHFTNGVNDTTAFALARSLGG